MRGIMEGRRNGRKQRGLGCWVILGTIVGGLERMVVAGYKRKSQGTHEVFYIRTFNLITTWSILMGVKLT